MATAVEGSAAPRVGGQDEHRVGVAGGRSLQRRCEVGGHDRERDELDLLDAEIGQRRFAVGGRVGDGTEVAVDDGHPIGPDLGGGVLGERDHRPPRAAAPLVGVRAGHRLRADRDAADERNVVVGEGVDAVAEHVDATEHDRHTLLHEPLRAGRRPLRAELGVAHLELDGPAVDAAKHLVHELDAGRRGAAQLGVGAGRGVLLVDHADHDRIPVGFGRLGGDDLGDGALPGARQQIRLRAGFEVVTVCVGSRSCRSRRRPRRRPRAGSSLRARPTRPDGPRCTRRRRGPPRPAPPAVGSIDVHSLTASPDPRPLTSPSAPDGTDPGRRRQEEASMLGRGARRRSTSRRDRRTPTSHRSSSTTIEATVEAIAVWSRTGASTCGPTTSSDSVTHSASTDRS